MRSGNAGYIEPLRSAWNLHRLQTLEAATSLGTLDDFTDPQTTAVLDRLTRYQARAQRAYYKALQELRILQTNRVVRLLRLRKDKEFEAVVPVLADLPTVAKQSQSAPKFNPTAAAISQIERESAAQLACCRQHSPVFPKPVAVK